MSRSRWLMVILICSLAAAPTIATAQVRDTTKQGLRDEPRDFSRDVLGALLGPNWNIFVHGGYTTTDRLLVQQVFAPVAGERALETSNGYNIGGGAGVDILLHMGLRASYTYTSSSLNFKTDNGDGSAALDVNDVGTLTSHTAALEVIRYMLPASAAFNPYGTLGILGTWWALDAKSTLVTSSGASTPFGFSPLFSFGVQFRGSHVGARLEAALSSGRNPFAGNKSFRAFSGTTIDEPTGISRADFRVAAVYHFGKL